MTDQHDARFRPDIEGLRGVAVLLVVAYHLGIPAFSGGYVGVDVFFVLSGYLITRLLTAEVAASGRIHFRRFYARRSRRLLPAASLVFVATLIAGWIICSPIEQQDITRSVSAAAAYVSNVLFAYRSTSYLADGGRGDPATHTWSLAVEEQFYLIWPLLIAWTARVGASKVRGAEQRRIALIVALVSAASLVGCIALTRVAQPWAFFASPARAWEFGVGALAGFHSDIGARWELRRASAVGGFGIAAVLAAGFLFSDGTAFPGFVAMLPVLGTAAVLSAGASYPTRGVGRLLSTPVLAWCGRLSYSWYLWHWPVLVFGSMLFPTAGLAVRITWGLFALALAAATNVLVENPARYSRALAARPGASLALALALTLGSLAVAQGVRVAAKRASDSPEQVAFTRARAEAPDIDRAGCNLSYRRVDQPECVFGDPASNVTVVLFGDSHAGHWFPALDEIARERHWRLIVLVKAECPTAAVRIASAKLGREYVECARWREAMLGRIAATKPAAAILSNSSYYVAREGSAPSRWQVSATEWMAGTRSTLSRLDRAGVPAMLIHDVLRPDFNVPVCLSRRAWSSLWRSTTCTFDRAGAVNAAAESAEQSSAIGLEKVTIADMNDAICEVSPCAGMRNGMVLYRDSNHITNVFSRWLAPVLAAKIGGLSTSLQN